MGLDIYLYKFNQPVEKIEADKAEMEAFSDKTWHFDGRKYDTLSESEKNGARAKVEKFAKRMGYADAHSDHPGEERANFGPSLKWPEHICNLDYLRSSYNGSGLNSHLDRLGLPGLGEIFSRRGEDYVVRPDWRASRDRAEGVLTRYLSLAGDGLDVEEVRAGIGGGIKGKESEVLAATREQLLKRPFGDGGAWSNSFGEFMPSGMNVVAIVRATPGFLGTGVYYVTKRDMTPETDWTRQALEIVIEMCDRVLAQPDPNAYCFHWSGQPQ